MLTQASVWRVWGLMSWNRHASTESKESPAGLFLASLLLSPSRPGRLYLPLRLSSISGSSAACRPVSRQHTHSSQSVSLISQTGTSTTCCVHISPSPSSRAVAFCPCSTRKISQPGR